MNDLNAIGQQIRRCRALGVRRFARLRLTSLAVVTLTACLGTDGAAGPAADLGGQWRYAGTQTIPTSITLAGTMALTDGSAGSFSGRVDLTESDASGVQRVVTGAVAGKGSDTGVDFDVAAASGTRRHIGSVRGDSIIGSWITLSPNGSVAASGVFRAARSSAPSARRE